jgi:hypothetical protein
VAVIESRDARRDDDVEDPQPRIFEHNPVMRFLADWYDLGGKGGPRRDNEGDDRGVACHFSSFCLWPLALLF